MVNTWWYERPAEIYFLETTVRDDIGVDLRAPRTDDAGHAHHGYALLPHVRPDDIIFHYRKPHGLVAWSRAAGPPYEEPLVWGARGRVAQRAGVKPYARPGWRVGLDGPFMLDAPVSLDELRHIEGDIRRVVEETRRSVSGAIYSPFQLSPRQPLRATQHYLTKFPAGLVPVVPGLQQSLARQSSPPSGRVDGQMRLGQGYVTASEASETAARDPFTVDPSIVDRGLRGHAATQNALARAVKALGFEPRSPLPDEPLYDLGWRAGPSIVVAEVKSLTTHNEERQLRLALGQVLRYRHVFESRGTQAKAVIAVERPPADRSWIELCRSHGILLCWPPAFEGLGAVV